MPKSTLRAILWDMDGVIADTATYHFKSWQDTFRKRGVNFAEEEFKRHFGQRNDTIIRYALGEGITRDEIETIAREKESRFREIMGERIKPLPGVIPLLEVLAEKEFKMALVSSAPLENIQLIITALDINKYFEVIISDQDVIEGKPNPQGFLLAAQRLGIAPENCIVIEDAIAGVAAAKRAGMRCLAVTTTHPRTSLMEADLVVETLEAITLNDLEMLFSR